MIKFRRGDLDGALEDYNKAIAFGTTVPNVFFDRGNVRRIKNDLKGAIEDYTQALKFDSRIVPAYVDRAIAYAGLHDYNHALEDVDRAADIAPDEPTVYSNRGSVHELRGEVEKAAADYRRYTELQPANNNGWLKLAVAEFRLKQWLNAAQHAAPYCDGKFFDRATFWGFAWLARIRAGDKAAADRELIKRSDARQPQHEDHSALEVVDFLLGREPETTLLSHSTQLNTNDDKARRCVALYYCGVKRLVEGDQTGGLQRFRECVQLGQTGLTVHVLAQFELSQHQP